MNKKTKILLSEPLVLSDHGAYLAKIDGGDIDVVCIDDLHLPSDGGLLLKIDVEGGELAVVRGALETLARFKRIIVVFEAHPKQVQRTNVDPVDLIKLIKTIRPCVVKISERPDIELTLNKPFFTEVPSQEIFNICVYTP